MKKEQVKAAIAAIGLATLARKRQVKWLQAYYKQGNRWYKVKNVARG